MGTIHGRVHRYLPLDQPDLVGVGQQLGEDLVPGAVTAEPPVSLPNRLPRPETFRQISPRSSRSIPVDDAFDHEPVIIKRPATLRRGTGHQRSDQRPLGIRQRLGSRHTKSSQTQPAEVKRHALEARPSPPQPPSPYRSFFRRFFARSPLAVGRSTLISVFLSAKARVTDIGEDLRKNEQAGGWDAWP